MQIYFIFQINLTELQFHLCCRARCRKLTVEKYYTKTKQKYQSFDEIA